MNNEIRDFLNLVKSGTTNVSAKISKEFNIEQCMELINKHHITTMIYNGLYKCNVKISDTYKNMMFQIALQEAVISSRQLDLIKHLKELLNKNEIDHVFLKGSVLKALYPTPETRRMGDIDILIRVEQYEKLKKLLQSDGYIELMETDHELKWRKNGLLIEFHKTLMPTYNKDFHKFFGTGWEIVKPKSKFEYDFNDEDKFIYLFTHFAKHFRDAGIGIIHLCDLYIYTSKTQLDYTYIEKCLKELKLYDFYKNIRKVMGVCFENEKETELSDFILNVILNSGSYGLHEKNVISNELKRKQKFNSYSKGRLYYFYKQLFPSLSGMKRRYPTLKKYPFLLPYYWICRIFRILFKENEKIEEKRQDNSIITDDEVQAYKEYLNYVGLDYNF